MNPSTDPVSVLLNTENNRTQAAQDLGRDLASLTDSITTYKDAWRTATAAGWARTDLLRAALPLNSFRRQGRDRPQHVHRRQEGPVAFGMEPQRSVDQRRQKVRLIQPRLRKGYVRQRQAAVLQGDEAFESMATEADAAVAEIVALQGRLFPAADSIEPAPSS